MRFTSQSWVIWLPLAQREAEKNSVVSHQLALVYTQQDLSPEARHVNPPPPFKLGSDGAAGGDRCWIDDRQK